MEGQASTSEKVTKKAQLHGGKGWLETISSTEEDEKANISKGIKRERTIIMEARGGW